MPGKDGGESVGGAPGTVVHGVGGFFGGEEGPESSEVPGVGVPGGGEVAGVGVPGSEGVPTEE